MKDHYVSYECAKRLHELGFDGVDKYYVTENFCMGNNPISFDTYSVGDLVDEYIVYFVNENNEDDYRGIPAPRLDQAAAWIREYHNWHIIIEPKIWNGLHYDFKLWHKFRGYENANRGFDFSTYESALSAGISKALELLGKEVNNA